MTAPTCPAGGACHRQPGCKDTACPGHPGPARVTRVKVRTPMAEPLPQSAWRDRLKHLAKAMLVCIVVMLASAAVVIVSGTKGIL